MKYEFVPMNLDYAQQMKAWRYDGHVKSIYVDPYFTSFQETGVMAGPGGCSGFAVLKQKSLIGLFEYYFQNGIIEIGLALNPELVGKGLGTDFVIQGVEFGIQEFDYQGEYIRLTVNTQNKPAIRVYQKANFTEYVHNGDEIEMRWYI